MDRQTLDKAVPFTYVVLLIAAGVFYPVALAPVAIFGALAIAAYYSFLRHKLVAGEIAGRDRQRDSERGPQDLTDE